MEENMVSEVLKNLCSFYNSSREWLDNYCDFAINFDTELVERKESFRDLNGILEDYTVLVLTANSVEQNILTQKLYREVNAESSYPVKLNEIYADGCVYQFAPTQYVNIVHIHPNSTSSFTVGGSANAIRSALERFRPKLVVSLGVAFGIDPKKQQLGDVLLSSGIIPYDIFNKDTDGIITLRPEDKYPTHEALNAWNVLTRNLSFPLEQNSKRYSLIDKELDFKWQFGTMLSGGSVLSNDNKKQALLKAAAKCGEEHIIGGEMEGIGIYFECSKPDIPCIVVKGICDWAAEKNSWETAIQIANQNHDKKDISSTNQTNNSIKDCVQAYAMDHATEALLRLFRFDSCFLDAYTKNSKNGVPSPYKLKQTLGRIKLFFISQRNTLLGVLITNLLLIAGFAVCNYFLNKQLSFKENNISWIVFSIELLVLLGISGILAIKRIIAIRPIKVSHVWVDFRFEHHVANHNLCIILNDSRPIFHVVFSRWIVINKIQQESQVKGDLKCGNLIGSCILDDLNRKTVIQIDYELSNGDHYVHLISRKKVRLDSSMYYERIFLIDGSKYNLIGIRKTMNSAANNYER